MRVYDIYQGVLFWYESCLVQLGTINNERIRLLRPRSSMETLQNTVATIKVYDTRLKKTSVRAGTSKCMYV